MRSGYMLRKLVMRPALPGIATGLIIAAAISLGETAPLLLTVGYNEKSPTFSLHDSPVGVPDLQRLHRLQPAQHLSPPTRRRRRTAPHRCSSSCSSSWPG